MGILEVGEIGGRRKPARVRPEYSFGAIVSAHAVYLELRAHFTLAAVA